MSDEQERIRFSKTAANAVAAAMRVTRSEMSDASEKRRLLLVLANAAASCAMLRIEYDDVMKLGVRRLQTRLSVTRPACRVGIV